MPPVNLPTAIDIKQWSVYAQKASKQGIVSLKVGPGGLKPGTTSRASNWLGRYRPGYAGRQTGHYFALSNAINLASGTDQDIANDQYVQQTRDELVRKIDSKAGKAKGLHWKDISPLLIKWQAAIRAAEITKAANINTRTEQAIAQLDKSGPFQGNEKDLAKAMLLPGTLQPRHASSTNQPSQLQAASLETLLNALCGASEDCSGVGFTAEQRANLKKIDNKQREVTVKEAHTAMDALLAAKLQGPLALIDKLGQDVAGLLRLDADCVAYFRTIQAGEQPTRWQIEAMRTVSSLGSFDPSEGAAKFGTAYVTPGVRNRDKLPWEIRQGRAALAALTQVNQYLTRCAMEARVLEDLAKQPIPTDKELRTKHLTVFKRRCEDLQDKVKASLRQMSLLSQTLAKLADFERMPPNWALILHRCGEHFEAMQLYLAGCPLPDSTVPNSYGAVYQLAALGKHDPKAALDLLRGALQHAQGSTQPPARSDSSKQLVSRDSRVTIPVDGPLEKSGNDQHLVDLIDELEKLADPKGGEDQTQSPSQDLDALIDELEYGNDGRSENRPRLTPQAMDEHLRVVNELYRSEVPRPVDIPDPGAPVEHQPAPPVPETQRPAPAPTVLREGAQEQINFHANRFRGQADYLTTLPHQQSKEVVNPSAAMRFHGALGKAPLPAEWGISVPANSKSLLPADLQRGAAATYALTQGPELLAGLTAQTQALTQAKQDAQGPDPDGSKAARMASTSAAYRQTYTATVKWFESRSQHLLSGEFLQAFSEEDQRELKQYGEALATMARVLRHPDSAEAQLFASTRTRSKEKRIRKNSENPRRKITRETSIKLRPHLMALRRQTWANTQTPQSLGTAPDGSSSDASMEQVLADMHATLAMSPRSLKMAQGEHDRKSVERSLHEGDRAAADASTGSTFVDVEELLKGLEESASHLYDGETPHELVEPIVAELAPHKNPTDSPRTTSRKLSQVIDTVTAERQVAGRAKLKDATATKAELKASGKIKAHPQSPEENRHEHDQRRQRRPSPADSGR